MSSRSSHRKRDHSNWRGIPPSLLRTVAFISTLLLAGLAIVMHVDSPVVWTFLGVAIGHTLPQLGQT